MRVVAVYSKRRAGEPMSRRAELRGIGGYGIEDDLHANAGSPRQVLIAGADDLRSLGLRDDSLRANIVLDRGVSDLSSGDVIRAGSLALRITMRCEACARLEDEQRGLSKLVGAKRGVLARVLVDGTLREGDEVTSAGPRLPALADDWHDRVRVIVCAIPAGTIVTFARLAEVAGVQRAYCRALPTVLRKAALAGAPVHRVVPADHRVSPEAARRLAAEGVDLARPSYWSTAQFYETDEVTSRGTASSSRGDRPSR